MKRSMVLLAGLSALGCTSVPLPGASSSSSSSGGGPQEPAVFAGYRAVLSAVCEYFERCESSLGPAFSSKEACLRAQAVQVQLDHAVHQAESQVYTVDAAVLATCLRALEGAVCVDRVPPELLACQDALLPRTPRMPGDQCSTQFAPDAPRCVQPAQTRCVPAASGCGICAAREANGSECTVNEECLSGYCGAALIGPRHCEDLPNAKGAGEGCLDTLECQGNLVCAGGLFQKTCRARVAAGEGCSASRNGDLPECTLDLVCVSGVCARRLADGQACQRNATGSPTCESFCVFTSSDAAQGTCALPAAMPGAGQPCALHAVGATPAPTCGGEGNLFTDERFTGTGGARQAVSCVCSMRQAGSTACFEDEACQTGTCTGETESAAGTCTTPLQDGAMCTGNADCASAFCGNTNGTRTCAAFPICQ